MDHIIPLPNDNLLYTQSEKSPNLWLIRIAIASATDSSTQICISVVSRSWWFVWKLPLIVQHNRPTSITSGSGSLGVLQWRRKPSQHSQLWPGRGWRKSINMKAAALAALSLRRLVCSPGFPLPSANIKTIKLKASTLEDEKVNVWCNFTRTLTWHPFLWMTSVLV